LGKRKYRCGINYSELNMITVIINLVAIAGIFLVNNHWTKSSPYEDLGWVAVDTVFVNDELFQIRFEKEFNDPVLEWVQMDNNQIKFRWTN